MLPSYYQTYMNKLLLIGTFVVHPINSLISDISLKSSFTYILDLGSGAVAYVAPTSENITPLVLEKLKGK